MVADKFLDKRNARFLRWIARGFGTLVGSLWFFAGFLSMIHEPCHPEVESIIMAALISGSIVGVIAAWLREFTGGIFLLVIAIMHSIFAFFAAGHNKHVAILVSGVPFFIAGILFITAWWKSKVVGSADS